MCMVYCIICGQGRSSTNHIHKVPQDENRRLAWSESCGISFKIGTYVCSKHFAPEHKGFKKLKASALPSILTQYPDDDPDETYEMKNVNIVDQFIDEKSTHDAEIDEVKIEYNDLSNTFDTNNENIFRTIKTEEMHEEEADDDILGYRVERIKVADSKGEHVDPLDLMKHKCDLCDFRTNHRVTLKTHTDSVHLKLKPHKCHMCNYAVNREHKLKKHIDLVHLKLKQKKCNFCDYVTGYQTNLRNHINSIHLNLKPHKCQLCNYAANIKSDIKKHMDAIHLNLKQHKCNLCDYRANRKSYLQKHIECVHLKLKKYKCCLCEYSVRYKGQLNNHLNNVHLKWKRHKCNLCDFATKIKVDLLTHIRSVHDGDKSYLKAEDELSLDEHISSVHSDTKQSDYEVNDEDIKISCENEVSVVQLNSELHYCYVCDFAANQKISLEQHIESVHLDSNECNNEANVEDLTIDPENVNIQWNSDVHYCHLCDFTANREVILEKHIDSVHLDSSQFDSKSNAVNLQIIPGNQTNTAQSNDGQDNSLICDNENVRAEHVDYTDSNLMEHTCRMCEFSTSEMDTLKSHVNKVHWKPRRHGCQLCDYKADKKTYLRRHVENVHLNLKQHKCSSCDYAANQKMSLKKHIESVHLNLNKHKCNFCAYVANQKFALNRHMSCVHLNEKQYKCHLCDFSSNQRCNIKRHMDAIHTTIKKLKCQLCEYATNVKQYLKNHMDVHLKKRRGRHKCQLCEYVAIGKIDLKGHIRAIHSN